MISIQLDDETAARARQLASSRHCTVEELLKQLVAATASNPQALATEPADTEACGLIGLFADEPELIDKIMEQIYHDRATLPLRAPGYGPVTP